MKCPEHPETELEKLPYNPKRRFGNNWYLCPIDKHEWLIHKSLLPKEGVEMPSHDELIEQGIRDYYATYDEWDLEGLIEEIIKLSILQGKISLLIEKMKSHTIKTHTEKKV